MCNVWNELMHKTAGSYQSASNNSEVFSGNRGRVSQCYFCWRLRGITVRVWVCVCFRSQQTFEQPSESWRKLGPCCRWTSWSAGREFCGASASPAPLMWSRWKAELPVKLAGRKGTVDTTVHRLSETRILLWACTEMNIQGLVSQKHLKALMIIKTIFRILIFVVLPPLV